MVVALTLQEDLRLTLDTAMIVFLPLVDSGEVARCPQMKHTARRDLLRGTSVAALLG
jgi:hypothetical protein